MHTHQGARAPRGQAVAAWRTLLRAHTLVMDDLAAALRRHELTANEFDVIISIGPHECVRHGVLAERVVLSRTALTRLIDRLVGRGLLERQHDAADGRGVRVRLTDAGRELRRTASRTNADVVERHFAALTPQDVATLQPLLDRLTTSTPTTTEEH